MTHSARALVACQFFTLYLYLYLKVTSFGSCFMPSILMPKCNGIARVTSLGDKKGCGQGRKEQKRCSQGEGGRGVP